MNICEHLSVTAKLLPDKEAVVFEGQRFSFAELDAMTCAAAEVLAVAGIARGDRVAIMLPNVPAFVVWYYAALRIGAIAVSISSRLTASEVAFLVSDCEAKVFIALEETLDGLQGELPDCVAKTFSTSEIGDQLDGVQLSQPSTSASWIATEPDEAGLILYTSGTTGFAKGATLSNMNVRSNVNAFNHLCNMEPHDRILLAVPLFHCFGQNALLNSAFNVGATLVLQRRFDPLEAKQLIKKERVTQLYGVPMMFQLLHDCCEPADLSSTSYCFSAAATLPIQTANRWQEKFGMPVYEGYGLTETSPFASYNHRIKFVPGSIGTPIDNVEMKIVDTQTGEDCTVGELGEIAIRGPNVMLGYWNRPEDTASAIRDGWFRSGDIGRQDASGFFYIVDRVKDMISVGGQKVFPAEVERVMLDHPAISQVAVVGFPDEVFGEKVVAFVVASESIANENKVADQLKRTAGQHLASYKVPREFIFIDELPRNPSGKILKRELREFDLGSEKRGDSDESASSKESTSEKRVSVKKPDPPQLQSQLEKAYPTNRKEVANTFVQGLVKSLTGTEDTISPETRFLDAGLDSLMIVEMSSQIQAEIGDKTEVPATLVFDYPRICDLSDYLLAAICPDDSLSTTNAAAEPSLQIQDFEPSSNANDQLTAIQDMDEQHALEELLRELEA